MDFSQRLKQLRKEKKVTQEQLAKIIGVERSSVGKYESSSVTPSPDVLARMSDYFGVSIDYLLGKVSNEKNADSPLKPTITDRDLQVALFGGDEEVTDAMWEEVKNFAAFVKSKNKKEE